MRNIIIFLTICLFFFIDCSYPTENSSDSTLDKTGSDTNNFSYVYKVENVNDETLKIYIYLDKEQWLEIRVENQFQDIVQTISNKVFKQGHNIVTWELPTKMYVGYYYAVVRFASFYPYHTVKYSFLIGEIR